jgi:hypothetical protein
MFQGLIKRCDAVAGMQQFFTAFHVQVFNQLALTFLAEAQVPDQAG